MTIGVHVIVSLPVFVYAILLVAYSLVLFYGCYVIQSNFFIPVICSAATTRKEIGFSFDDGPASSFTPDILQVLEDHNVEAAFFCIGNRIPANETLLKQLHARQHLIGNHSHSHHFWFDLFSAKKMQADLAKMDDAVETVTGLKPKLFRPPYGVINPNLAKAITRGGYIPVGWSVRSMDTVVKNEGKLLRKLKASLKPGAIYLFHDTSRATLAILPEFISWVKDNGYAIVRLDKMLHLRPYA